MRRARWRDARLAGTEARAAQEPDYPNPLAVRDNLLRVMAAHVTVLPSGHDFFVDGPDTLLEACLALLACRSTMGAAAATAAVQGEDRDRRGQEDPPP